MGDNALLAVMRRMGVDKEEMSGHGFRAVARTILDEVLHIQISFIEQQLAHSVRDQYGKASNRNGGITLLLHSRLSLAVEIAPSLQSNGNTSI